MSDLDTTLAAIDDAISRCIVCGKPRRSSPSPYYCGEGCQQGWSEERVPLPDWHQRAPRALPVPQDVPVTARVSAVDTQAAAFGGVLARIFGATGAVVRRRAGRYGSGSSRSRV